jgi:ribosome-associated protein
MAVKRAKTTRRSDSEPLKAKTAKRSTSAAASRGPAKKTAKKAARKAPAGASPHKVDSAKIVQAVEGALDEMKAVNVQVLDVRRLTDIADTMIIASGNSDRHVRSIADRVIEHARKAGFRPLGVEGEREGEWVLVDLQDVIVHIMLPRVREFYRLESLWDVGAARREVAAQRA